jgi:hypothetical protein
MLDPASMRFSDLEHVPAVLNPELEDVKARAVRAAHALGVAGPLRYIGAGASAVVFQSGDGELVLKVARLGPPESRYRPELERQKRVDFLAEAEYTMDTEDRDLPVAYLAPNVVPAFLHESIVIAKLFIPGKPANMGTRGLGALWERINQAMSDRWGPIEFKEANFIIPRGGSPILVDTGGAVRRGQNLIDHATAAARGVIDDPDAECRGKTRDESYLRWSIRMDTQDGRISQRDADRTIAELDARFGLPGRLPNPAPKRSRPYVPCPRGVHQRALEDDAIWATWPLLIRDPELGIETRRCPDCDSTQSRLLEENPRRCKKNPEPVSVGSAAELIELLRSRSLIRQFRGAYRSGQEYISPEDYPDEESRQWAQHDSGVAEAQDFVLRLCDIDASTKVIEAALSEIGS